MTKEYREKDKESSYLLRTVSVPEGFLFFSDFHSCTGEFALSLPELSDRLKRIPLQAVEFHFERSDLIRWVDNTIGDKELASRLSLLDKTSNGEMLRKALVSMFDKRLSELEEIKDSQK